MLPQNDLTRKMIDLPPLQKLPKNVGDFRKIIVAKGFKKLPMASSFQPAICAAVSMSNKSPNLVTLYVGINFSVCHSRKG